MQKLSVRLSITTVAMALVALLLSPASAHARGFRAERVDPSAITMDGIPGEWNARKMRLTETVQGKAGQDAKPDLAAEVVLAYDDTHVYLGAEVTDDQFRPGGDRVTLTLGFAGKTTHSISIIPGTPGKSPGRALQAGGAAIAGAEVVEAPVEGGYTLEAKIPWSAFPPAKTIRVGLRGAVQVHDADASGAVEAIVSNAKSTSFANLPPLNTVPEMSLAQGLLRKSGVPKKPSHNLMANVTGDAMKERVLVFGSYLVVLGPNFRKGTQYYWNDMNLPNLHLAVFECTTRDVTGDGRAEIVLRKRFGKGKRWREVFQVLSFGDGDTPRAILEHETALQSEIGAIQTKVTFVPDGAKQAIHFEPGAARGYTAESYNEATETGMEPLLLPWGDIEKQIFKFQGGSFVKSLEKTLTSAPAATPKPAAPSGPKAAPPPPPKVSSAELQSQVYASYKKARGVSGEPRFSIRVDAAGDASQERVLLHDRDLVVFGPGYQGGKGYAYSTLTAFADEKDIASVTAKDVTGDGKAEVIVRGVFRAKAPPEAGGAEVEREVVLIYQVRADRLVRVFAAEVERRIGSKSVSGGIAFSGTGKKATITLSPGKASGWTEASYPFNPETSPVGGVEPLLLPWGGAKPVQYRFNGTAFER